MTTNELYRKIAEKLSMSEDDVKNTDAETLLELIMQKASEELEAISN